MEQIHAIELADPLVYPDETVLRKVLGAGYATSVLVQDLFVRNGMTADWRYYQDGKAWLCKVQHKSRTILWMSAWSGYLKATVYFPEKHVEGLLALPLSDRTRTAVRQAKNVGKSKPCMFELREPGLLEDLETVVRYKLGCR